MRAVNKTELASYPNYVEFSNQILRLIYPRTLVASRIDF